MLQIMSSKRSRPSYERHLPDKSGHTVPLSIFGRADEVIE